MKWYTFLNIPVWYPWTAKHEKAVKQRRELEYLQPPAEVLQVAATLVIRTPTAILPSALLPSSASTSSAPSFSAPSASPSSPAHSESYESHLPQPASDLEAIRKACIATKPWTKFFQAREELNRKSLANEKPSKREIRLNRDRRPPIKRVAVFVWDWSDEDPKQFVRTKVATNREAEDILSTYKESYLVYDPFSNVWDACEYFGEPADDDDLDDDVPMFDPPSTSAAPSAGVTPSTDATPSHVPCPSVVVDDDKGASERIEHEAFFQERFRQLGASRPSEQFQQLFLSYPSDSHDLAQDSFDILGYLAFHYGFVPPLPLQSHHVTVKDWQESIKNVGLDVSKNSPSDDYSGTVVNFIKGFLLTTGPSKELWDLCPGNRRLIDKQRLSQVISKKRDDLFFLNSSYLGDEPRFSWTVALTTAADALFVYRLIIEKDFSALSLIFLLIDEGIRFLTLLPLLPTIKTTIRTTRALIPIRVKDYVFNESDYYSYVQERARILSSPRGRAALLEGGIIGRIAKEHLGHDRAALGPSPAVTIHRQGFFFVDSIGTTYWDDRLTDDEISSICGSYRCYTGKLLLLYFYPFFINETVTGNGSQMSEVSWWPTPTHWNNRNANGYNWGHWTEWDEVWYQERVRNILSGHKTGVPFTQSDWRSKLKGAGPWRKVTKRVEDESKAFV